MDNWKEQDNLLEKSFKFKDFIEAWAFMNQVAMCAEKMNHHPDWSNVYNQVHIRLTTHDQGNQVTESDRQLAAQIDRIAASYAGA